MADTYEERHYIDNQESVEGVIINPVQRYDFDFTNNEEREQREIDEWWDVKYINAFPYIGDTYLEYVGRMGESEVESETEFDLRMMKSQRNWFVSYPNGMEYVVRCLDGGAWDRSTNLGHFDNLDDALELAKSYKKSI